MRFEVICKRGDAMYLVRRGESYCLVNLATKKFNESDEPGVFLKLGYFEDVEALPQSVLEGIEEILSSPDSRVLI